MRTSDLFVDGRRVALSDVADTWASRFRGLLGRRELPEALVLSPESSVHGIGMRVPLDVALLDGDGVVLRALVLRPWGVTRPQRGTASILEAPLGSFGPWGLHLGSTVTLGRAGTVVDA
jgi:uncharacterized membrane protein (UPF0127 family)